MNKIPKGFNHASTSHSPALSGDHTPVFTATRYALNPPGGIASLIVRLLDLRAMQQHTPDVITVELPTSSFPLSEGIGVFVGVIAWDLLVNGQLEIVKAALIAAPFTLAWFGVRCWKERSKKKLP